MSEPLKKPGHTPESYSPRDMPEIMRLLGEQQCEANDTSEGAASAGGNGMLPGIRPILEGMKGHNYALPDCLHFLWERLRESPKMDFWRFAALTGDSVAPVYNRNPSTRREYCVSGYLSGPAYIAALFDALGYGHTYVTAEEINADKEKYLRRVTETIDRGLPVLVKTAMADVPGWESDVGTHCLLVGYADGGKTLYVLTEGDVPLRYDAAGEIHMDWIFAGAKQREVTAEALYLSAIGNMVHWLTLPEREGMCFGAAALRAWAEDIEGGRYEDESVDLWDNYGVYVCNLATSGGEPTYLFRQLAELNPQYAHYAALGEQIQALLPAETPTGGKTLDWIRLDELKGGMHVKRKTLRSRRKRSKIAAVLRGRAGRLDEAVQLLRAFEGYSPKDMPEIMRLLGETQERAEKLVDMFTAGKAVFELFDRPEVLWVGTLAWAADNDSEPDTDALLKKYQALCGPAPKQARIHPDWSAGISINYCLGGKAPRGMLFAQETWSPEQDCRYDLFTQPAGLYLRVRLDKHAEKLMGKKHYGDADMYGLLERIAAARGYRRAADNPIDIFYHDHEHHTGKYACIPVEKAPDGYAPKDMPEIMRLLSGFNMGGALPSDSIEDPFAGGEPPRTSNRILEYRKIQPWENYFLASALCSMGKILGSDVDNLHFYSAITGDMFTYLYSTERKYCDSGVTNSFFTPRVVKKAYAAMGYDCIYISTEYISRNFRTVMNAIKASVDRDIPVLAWGIGNVTCSEAHYSPLPEGCLIGGYGKGDVLHVHLYCGPERVETDEDGYTAITGGLDATYGLFFVGEPIEKTPVREVYREAIATIPSLLTLPSADGFVFGRAAFETWADTLLDESNFEGKTDQEIEGLGLTWDIHCAPYCTVCTSDALNFVKTAAKEHKIETATKLLPLYKQFTKRRQKIWKLQGGFSPPAKKFKQRKFREKIAKLLREMGGICGEMAAV